MFIHVIWTFSSVPAPVGLQSAWASMNELDSLRQEAETLKNAIRVSITTMENYKYLQSPGSWEKLSIEMKHCQKVVSRHWSEFKLSILIHGLG